MLHFNNVLTQSEIDTVTNNLSDSKWGFGFTSTDPDKPIWNYNTEAGKPVAELVASKLLDYTLLSWNINGQTIGQNGAWHQDSYEDCTHAFIYFFQDWNYTWGGRLHLSHKGGPTIITPERNIGILFDASIYHYAEAPTVNNVMRISVGLKLKENVWGCP